MSKHFQSYFLSTLLILVLTAALCLVGGLVGAVCSIIISVLLGMQTTKYHYYYLSATSVLILAIVGAFGGVVNVFLVGVPVVLMGLALGFGTNLKLSIHKLMSVCTGITLADSMIKMSILGKIDPQRYSFEVTLSDAYEQSKNIVAQYDLDAGSLEKINQMLSDTVKLIRTLSPAMFIIISMVLAFITIMIFKKVQQKNDQDMSFLKPFYLLRADKLTGILFLIILLLFSQAPEGLFFDTALNVIVVLAFIYFIFGLSYLDFKMKQDGVQKTTRRLILLCVIPATSIFSIISETSIFFLMPLLVVSGIGVADSLYNYRDKIKKAG